MASPDLRRLWVLQGIDSALILLRQQATQLDVGQAEAKKLAELEKLDATIGVAARSLAAEQVDAELKAGGIQEKLDKFEKQLFGGSVTNAREVEAIEKEMAMLKRQRSQVDEQLLRLMDEIPPAKAAGDKLAAEMLALKKAIHQKRQAAIQLKPKLEEAYKRESARRAEAAKAVSAGLLAKYEAIRPRHDGVGMAEVTRERSCGACGTLLPERTLAALLDDRVVSCESCHRLLYFTEGVV